jgi:hypothetical protein
MDFDSIENELEKGNLLRYVSIKDTYNVKYGFIVDVYVRNKEKPATSTYIKLKNNNFFWEINSMNHLFLGSTKCRKRRSDFRMMIDKHLKK